MTVLPQFSTIDGDGRGENVVADLVNRILSAKQADVEPSVDRGWHDGIHSHIADLARADEEQP